MEYLSNQKNYEDCVKLYAVPESFNQECVNSCVENPLKKNDDNVSYAEK